MRTIDIDVPVIEGWKAASVTVPTDEGFHPLVVVCFAPDPDTGDDEPVQLRMDLGKPMFLDPPPPQLRKVNLGDLALAVGLEIFDRS